MAERGRKKRAGWSGFRDLGAWAVVAGWLVCVGSNSHYGGVVCGDGMQYYAYVRALVVHGDLVLHPDDRVPTEERSAFLQEAYLLYAGMHNGYVTNQTSAGLSLFWLPAVAVTHGGLLLGHAVGMKGLPPADGFSHPYQVATSWTTLLGGLAGLLMGYAIACRFVPSGYAAFAVLVGLFATPLFHYIAYDTSYSEGPSFFGVTLVFWIWWRLRAGAGGVRWWAAWGAAAALAAIMRPTQIFVFVPVVWEWVSRWREKHGRGESRERWREFGACVAGIAPIAVFQLAVWYVGTGRVTPPPSSALISDLTRWDPLPLLLSARHGLFATHPAWLFGVIGAIALLRRGGAWMGVLLGSFGFLIWMNQLPTDFWAGHAFGARRFVPVTVLCLVGLAWVVEAAFRAVRRWPGVVVFAVALPLVVLSLSSQKSYRRDGDRRDSPDPQFPRLTGTLDRVYQRVGWPFSWPANLIWAAQHGTAPDRYDRGSALFIDNHSDLSSTPYDPRVFRLDFRHPNAAEVVRERPVEQGSRGVRIRTGVTTVWIDHAGLPDDRKAILRLVAEKSGTRITVRMDGKMVAEGRFDAGEHALAWSSPARSRRRGTNDLEIEGGGGSVWLERLDLAPGKPAEAIAR